jgi:hypothetical protein
MRFIKFHDHRAAGIALAPGIRAGVALSGEQPVEASRP